MENGIAMSCPHRILIKSCNSTYYFRKPNYPFGPRQFSQKLDNISQKQQYLASSFLILMFEKEPPLLEAFSKQLQIFTFLVLYRRYLDPLWFVLFTTMFFNIYYIPRKSHYN